MVTIWSRIASREGSQWDVTKSSKTSKTQSIQIAARNRRSSSAAHSTREWTRGGVCLKIVGFACSTGPPPAGDTARLHTLRNDTAAVWRCLRRDCVCLARPMGRGPSSSQDVNCPTCSWRSRTDPSTRAHPPAPTPDPRSAAWWTTWTSQAWSSRDCPRTLASASSCSWPNNLHSTWTWPSWPRRPGRNCSSASAPCSVAGRRGSAPWATWPLLLRALSQPASPAAE